MLASMTRPIASHRVWLPAILMAAITAGTALPASAATTFKIDIDSTDGGGLETQSVFTSLNATAGNSVTVNSVTFTESGSQGDRNRSGPGSSNPLADLLTDFTFNDNGGDLGLEISGLPEGIWEARLWSYEPGGGGANPSDAQQQEVGVKDADNSDRQIFVSTFDANPTAPATFLFDTADFDDDFVVFVSGTIGGNGGKARFNGLELTLIPEPASVALVGLGGIMLLSRRRR